MDLFREIGFFFLFIRVIRLFDHPFIPLLFHWRTGDISTNHENTRVPAVFINRFRAGKMDHCIRNEGYFHSACRCFNRFNKPGALMKTLTGSQLDT